MDPWGPKTTHVRVPPAESSGCPRPTCSSNHPSYAAALTLEHAPPTRESVPPLPSPDPFPDTLGASPTSQPPLPTLSLGALSTECGANLSVLPALSGCPANVLEN